MAENIVAGTDRRKRSVIRKWAPNLKLFAGNVFIDGDSLYKVNEDHISSSISSDVSEGKIERLDRRIVNGGFRDIGPYYASAGYYARSGFNYLVQVQNLGDQSENRDTQTRLSEVDDNEVVVGYAPLAGAADDGDWTDGGRVTVRYGFRLRLQKLNVVD